MGSSLVLGVIAVGVGKSCSGDRVRFKKAYVLQRTSAGWDDDDDRLIKVEGSISVWKDEALCLLWKACQLPVSTGNVSLARMTNADTTRAPRVNYYP